MKPQKHEINSNPTGSQKANQNPAGVNPAEAELNEEQLDEVAGGGHTPTPPVPGAYKSFPEVEFTTTRKEIW